MTSPISTIRAWVTFLCAFIANFTIVRNPFLVNGCVSHHSRYIMIKGQKTALLLGMLNILITGCEDLTDHEKFQRPDWLPGKLYTTVSAQEDCGMFMECLQISGLDSILDVSGSWTVFAPTDEAMQQYLLENDYTGIADIPLDALEEMVEFHVLQNPWTLDQLQSLGEYGWRTGKVSAPNAYAFKRQTILKNPVEKYWIKRSNNREMIVTDPSIADRDKRVFVESRKYVPVFYDGYLEINGLSPGDYRFYFNRDFEQGNTYFAGARIIRPDIFAENGFVHVIDRVVNPMRNGKEILERQRPGESYQLFLEMVYWYYPDFTPNMPATYNQPEVRLGGVVDTLWSLNYTGLAFNLQQETYGNEGFYDHEALVRHNGLFAPTDEAFGAFIDGILTLKSGYPHWRNYQSLPPDIVKILIPRHFVSSPIYPSVQRYREIFLEEGRFKQDEGDILRKEFGSNCTFIGLKGYVPDRVFTSVTGPVFLRPSFTTFRLAMQFSGTHEQVATYHGDLCFFPISDYALSVDSSMILNWTDKDAFEYNFLELNRYNQRLDPLRSGAIRTRILNHVGTSLPNGSANKEFIPTVGGNYLVWNNSENTIQGNAPSTIGYNGEIATTCTPSPLGGPHDGQAWSVEYWFNFRHLSMTTVISRYSGFFNLLKQAGLFNVGESRINFLGEYQNYTVFVPTNEAVAQLNTDTLSTEELQDILKYHFLRGEIIFTDNKQPSGLYTTESTGSLDIRTGPDVIEILDSTGVPYVTIPEQEYHTNIMVASGSAITSIVHEIDQVLIR